MGEYAFLMVLGVVAALAVVAGFPLRRPALANRRAKGKAGNKRFHREQARFVDGGGEVWDGDDPMDLGKAEDEGFFKDDRF